MSDINLNSSSEVIELEKSKEIIELTNKLLQKDKDNEQLTRLLSKTERLLQRANNYNEDLRKELSALNSKLHDYRNCNNKDVSTQVSEAAIEEAYGNKPMPEWGGNTVKNLSTTSIAETLKAAAEAELKNLLNPESENQEDESKSNEDAHKQIQEDTTSEYVYDAATGFYYHPATGYYWDPSSELFYEYTTGTYYQYDQQTGEYKVHSVVEAIGKPQIISGNSAGQAQYYSFWPSNPCDVDSLSCQLSTMKIDPHLCKINALEKIPKQTFNKYERLKENKSSEDFIQKKEIFIQIKEI